MTCEDQIRSFEQQPPEHSYPIAQPLIICPACEDYWCLVLQMETVRSPIGPPTYYLLAECHCGASWAGVDEEGA